MRAAAASPNPRCRAGLVRCRGRPAGPGRRPGNPRALPPGRALVSGAWGWAAVLVAALAGAAAAPAGGYYDVLGVGRGADAAEIRRAYRSGALKWHPDKAGGDRAEAEGRFRQLAEAYEVLSDPGARARYDASLDGAGVAHFQFEFAQSADDVFKEFFGGADPFEQASREVDSVFQQMSEEVNRVVGGLGSMFDFSGIASGFGFSFSSSSSTVSDSGGDRTTTRFEHQETAVGPDGTVSTRRVVSDTSGDGEANRAQVPVPGGDRTTARFEHSEAAVGPDGAVSTPRAVSDASGGGEEAASRSRGPERVPDGSLRAGGRAGDEGLCATAAAGLRVDMEPADGAIKHVEGSACCAVSTDPSATTQHGCCLRCAERAACSVFVWAPSSGSCWLLRWSASAGEGQLAPARDRVTGAIPRERT